MGSRYMDYPSPQGVHVPETFYASDPDDDPYRRPSSHRNRYSRSVHQTPRFRDVTWISSPPDPTPQTPYAPPTPWLPSPQVPSTPAHRPPPSPAPTVGEHMTVDDLALAQYDVVDPYHRPQRPSLIKSFWKGLKKLSRFQPGPPYHMPRPGSYMGQTVGIPGPGPGLSAPVSDATQYEYVSQTPYASPYARPTSVGATPGVIPGSLRASPVPVPSMDFAPPITVVSPSIPPSPLPNSIRSARLPSPALRHHSFVSPSIPPSPLPSSIRSARSPSPARRSLSVGMPEPMAAATEEGSQTLHEPVYAEPGLQPFTSTPIPILASDDSDEVNVNVNVNAKFPLPQRGNGMGMQPPLAVERSSSKGSLSSTMARVRRFVTELDGLPWVADSQIANEYVPDMNPRSRLRTRVRQGAEPSWYNPRPEVVERPEFWSEWDKWAAMQSTAGLWGANRGAGGWAGVGAGAGAGAGGLGQGQFGMVYPQGYVPAQPGPGFVYPSGYPPPGMVNDQGHAPVVP